MKIHFIGIGGIGVSALAQYYLSQSHQVSGSDLNSSEITELLRKKGVKVFLGEHKTENVPKNADIVIFSPAVQQDNLELKKCLELQVTSYKLQIMSYPQALGELTKKYFTVAVSGTHGKSTTTAMIALIMAKAGLDPTVILGTKLKEFGNSNFRLGKNKYLAIEADEYASSFLNYWPKIIVLTNIEPEHLDYFKDMKHILRTYQKYISHLPKEGVLVINEKLKIKNEKLQCKIKKFSLNQPETKKLKKILKIPGEHNVLNALAALQTARVLKIPDKISFQALSEYRGAWRRFEEKSSKIENGKLKIISDYGHHPTEVLATMKAAREKYQKEKILLVFQPHQHQRTFFLLKEFVSAFRKIVREKLVDETIITDIFDVAGRENRKIREKISGKKLVKKINRKTINYVSEEKLVSRIKKRIKSEIILIIMGAGDIYKLPEKLSH